MIKKLLGLVFGVLVSLPLYADNLGYRSVYVVGDSAVDNCNFFRYGAVQVIVDLASTEHTMTFPVGTETEVCRRGSNGPLVPEHLEKMLGVPTARPHAAGGFMPSWKGKGRSVNTAAYGAEVDKHALANPGLWGMKMQTYQLKDWKIGDIGPEDLLIVSFGGNDIMSCFGKDENGQSKIVKDCEKHIDGLMRKMRYYTSQLLYLGFIDIVYFSAPPLELAPLWAKSLPDDLKLAMEGYIEYWNNSLQTKVIEAPYLFRGGARGLIFDLTTTTREAYDEWKAAGRNVTEPCIDTSRKGEAGWDFCDQTSNSFFYDLLHGTTRIYKEAAAKLYTFLQDNRR